MHNSQATYLYNRKVTDHIGLNLRNLSAKNSQIEKYLYFSFFGLDKVKFSPPSTSFSGFIDKINQ